MLKFKAVDDRDGSDVVGLVLSSSNIDKLKCDLPIEVDLRDLGYDHAIKIQIIYGGTDEDMLDKARKMRAAHPNADARIQRKHHEG